MKITDLKTFVVGNPWKNWIFIQLYTDEGLVGLGEATGGLATKPNLGDHGRTKMSFGHHLTFRMLRVSAQIAPEVL